MRCVIQRVSAASVSVGGQIVGTIQQGLLALVGVAKGDTSADTEYVASKIRDLRIFNDDQGRMNRALADVGGAVLVVSQFTLLGDIRKGRRPGFDDAAPPDIARQLYEELTARLRAMNVHVETGVFQAHMDVSLVNDGPVTILLDSRRLF
jgi:D-tyrosyl-tRNA(Tyr) deacylase